MRIFNIHLKWLYEVMILYVFIITTKSYDVHPRSSILSHRIITAYRSQMALARISIHRRDSMGQNRILWVYIKFVIMMIISVKIFIEPFRLTSKLRNRELKKLKVNFSLHFNPLSSLCQLGIKKSFEVSERKRFHS